jgi:hypothetical protein
MNVLQSIAAALPVVATSWQALIGYVAVVIAFVVVTLKVTRNKNLLNRLKSLPETDRARVLQMEMGAAYLAKGLSPEQWLQQQRQRFYFLAFLSVSVLAAGLLIAAWQLTPRGENSDLLKSQAQKAAMTFLGKLDSQDLNDAYELLPNELRTNIGFAQFQADMARLLFQVPSRPLRRAVEQVFDSGGFYNFVLATEFSVDTKTRDLVTFAKGEGPWKLWSYSWQPWEWPAYWPASTQTDLSAAAVMKVYDGLSPDERSIALPERFRGHITGSNPGWKLVVEGQTNQGAYRCSVQAKELDSSIMVELKNAVGGCKLKPGQRITVFAMLSGVRDSRIELEAVRFFPD